MPPAQAAAAGYSHSLRLEYGLPVLSGAERLRMFARASMLGDGDALGLGAALELSEALAWGYEAQFAGGADAAADSEHRLYLRYRSRF